MVAVTYGVTRVPAAEATERAQVAASHKSYLYALHGSDDGSRACSRRTARLPDMHICCRTHAMSAAIC